MTTRCICGKIYKNVHGLKIHQARMKCVEKEKEVQHTGPEPGETQEPSQESPHRAQCLPAPQSSNPSRIVQQLQWIKWPSASKGGEWSQFDRDVMNIIQVTAKGDADRRLHMMTGIITGYTAESFGFVK